MTSDVIVRSPKSSEPGGIRSLILPKSDFVRLRGPSRLHLSFAMEYEIVETDDKDRGPWKVSTRQYRYHVVNDARDEILLWHWLPLGLCTTEQPHMHIGQSQLTRDAVLSRKLHIVTGRLAIETVIQTLISELNVFPARENYQEILDEGRANFERWQTWS